MLTNYAYKSLPGHWLLKRTFQESQEPQDGIGLLIIYELGFNFATMVAEGALCVVYDVCYNRSVVEVAMTVKSLKLFLIDMAIQWLAQKYKTQLNSGNISLSLPFDAWLFRRSPQLWVRYSWCLHKLIPLWVVRTKWIIVYYSVYIYVCLRWFDFRTNILRDPGWVCGVWLEWTSPQLYRGILCCWCSVIHDPRGGGFALV